MSHVFRLEVDAQMSGEPNAYPDFTGLVDEVIIRLLTGGPEVVKGMFHSVKLLD